MGAKYDVFLTLVFIAEMCLHTKARAENTIRKRSSEIHVIDRDRPLDKAMHSQESQFRLGEVLADNPNPATDFIPQQVFSNRPIHINPELASNFRVFIPFWLRYFEPFWQSIVFEYHKHNGNGNDEINDETIKESNNALVDNIPDSGTNTDSHGNSFDDFKENVHESSYNPNFSDSDTDIQSDRNTFDDVHDVKKSTNNQELDDTVANSDTNINSDWNSFDDFSDRDTDIQSDRNTVDDVRDAKESKYNNELGNEISDTKPEIQLGTPIDNLVTNDHVMELSGELEIDADSSSDIALSEIVDGQIINSVSTDEHFGNNENTDSQDAFDDKFGISGRIINDLNSLAKYYWSHTHAEDQHELAANNINDANDNGLNFPIIEIKSASDGNNTDSDNDIDNFENESESIKTDNTMIFEDEMGSSMLSNQIHETENDLMQTNGTHSIDEIEIEITFANSDDQHSIESVVVNEFDTVNNDHVLEKDFFLQNSIVANTINISDTIIQDKEKQEAKSRAVHPDLTGTATIDDGVSNNVLRPLVQASEIQFAAGFKDFSSTTLLSAFDRDNTDIDVTLFQSQTFPLTNIVGSTEMVDFDGVDTPDTGSELDSSS